MTRIHVRRDIIAKDKRLGTCSAALGIETTGQRKRYGRKVKVLGPVTFVYRPGKPLGCGARCWAETSAKVRITR